MSELTPSAPPSGGAASTGTDRGRSLPRLVAYLVLGAAALLLLQRALQLPSSRWEPLGAGAFPSIVLGALAALCVLGIAVEAMSRRRAGTATVAETLRAHRLVLVVLGAFVLYVLALPWLGFAIASFGFLLATQLFLAPSTWGARITALVLAVIFSFGLEWLFANVFSIFLPRSGLID